MENLIKENQFKIIRNYNYIYLKINKDCVMIFPLDAAIAKTKQWIETVNKYVIASNDKYYQAYMPYATKEQFETCYSKEKVENMRCLKAQYDPEHRFGNAHTAKYYD